MAYVNEAVRALQEGTASLKEIDQEMVSFGMPDRPAGSSGCGRSRYLVRSRAHSAPQLRTPYDAGFPA